MLILIMPALCRGLDFLNFITLEAGNLLNLFLTEENSSVYEIEITTQSRKSAVWTEWVGIDEKQIPE